MAITTAQLRSLYMHVSVTLPSALRALTFESHSGQPGRDAIMSALGRRNRAGLGTQVTLLVGGRTAFEPREAYSRLFLSVNKVLGFVLQVLLFQAFDAIK